jgi:hypothetical protein
MGGVKQLDAAGADVFKPAKFGDIHPDLSLKNLPGLKVLSSI